MYKIVVIDKQKLMELICNYSQVTGYQVNKMCQLLSLTTAKNN